MANPEPLAVLKEGVKVWNEWRVRTGFIPDLRGADLRGAIMSGAVLMGANLLNADLRGADVHDTWPYLKT